MDPEVSWQGAPAQPHPVPQSNPSHSQPYLSQLSPLKTCRMAGSPLLLLSFFHLKPCQVFPFPLSVVFNFFSSFPFCTNWALSPGQAANFCRAEMQPELSASVCWCALTPALVRAVQQVTVTFMNWAGIGLLIQPLLFFSKKEKKKKQEAEKRGAKS